MEIMYTLNNVYRLEFERFNSILFTDESYKFRCVFRVYENTMNILIVELNMNEYDVLELIDVLYSYMSFGGYNSKIQLSKTSTTNRFEFLINKIQGIDHCDQLVIREINQVGVFTDRVKLNFYDEAGTEFSIYDLFFNLYETFLFDFVDLYDIAPDFA